MAKQATASDPQVLLNKALQLQQVGQWQQAAGQYRKYLRLQPDHAEVWHALAGVCFQMQKLDQAQDALVKAVEVAPGNADYLNDLGGLYLTQKNLAKAAECYRRVLTINPQHQGVRYNLSQVLFEQGQVAEAIELLQRLVSDKPDYVEAHYNLGVAQHYQGQIDAAIEALERVLKLQPGFVSAHIKLGNWYQEFRQRNKAIRHYRKALEYQPDDSRASRGLAECLHTEGKTEDALSILRQAITKHPSDAELHATLGRILHDHGDLKAAEPSYLQALEIQPEHTTAVFGLSSVRKFSREDQNLISHIESLKARVKTGQAGALHFALGKIYNDCREYDRAFGHYREANRIRRQRIAYNYARHEKRLEAAIRVFTEWQLQALEQHGSDSERPVFIVGMPRSGTTLTEQILSAHPQAHGAGELVYFSSVARGLAQLLKTDQPYPDCLAGITAKVARQITDGFLSLLDRHSESTLRVSDKMPGNFWYLGLIAGLFPHAALVHCRRDPLDVCLSVYFQSFAEAQAHDYAWELTDIAHYYNLYRRLMQHWQKIMPGRILEIDYDALVEDPEPHARRLIEHCGLDWDPACLEFHKAKREVRTASNWQVRQPLYKTSRRRWENYRPYLGEVMEILGYDETTGKATAPLD